MAIVMSVRACFFLLPFGAVVAILGCGEPAISVDAGTPTDAAYVDDASLPIDASRDPDTSVAPDAASALDAFVAADVAPTRCGLDAGEVPTFRALYADVITPYRCAECHRVGGFSSTTLDLSSVEVAYAGLVGVLGCDDVTPRVTPCDPSASTLALIPTGRAESCGGRHTFGGVNPTGIVTPEERDRIDAWIAAGASY
jgi:hypothetical protein